jgi:serine protease inhibitor
MQWPFVRKANLSPRTNVPSQPLTETSNSAATRFAFKLFHEIQQNSKLPNTFFSPVSVMLCLALIYEGASGETREAIANVLESTDRDANELPSTVATLRASCLSDNPEVTLESANSLWLSPNASVHAEYIAKAIQDYQAEIRSLELNPHDAVAAINAWVNDKTHGKIKEIVQSLGPLTALIALNTVYFKGAWRSPFPAGATCHDSFHGSDGRELRVPFMWQGGSLPYCETDDFQAVLIPYKSSRFGMYVFLPSQNSTLKEFMRHLDSGAWDGYATLFKPCDGILRLPRFKTSFQTNLKPVLSRLGMEIAFDPQHAEFDRIHPRPPEIWLGEVLHHSVLEVTEEGTEAAAVTVGTFGAAARMPERKFFQLKVDRPFFFAICDLHNNTILFMGSIGQLQNESPQLPSSGPYMGRIGRGKEDGKTRQSQK